MVVALQLAQPVPAKAATDTWIDTTGNWDTAANWLRLGVNAVPVFGDDVVISVAGVNTITYGAVSGFLSLTSLSLSGTNTLAVTGGTLSVFGSLTNSGTIDVSGGTLSFNGTTLSNTGSLNVLAGGIVNLGGTLLISSPNSA